jgi:BirA family biotin operon repressor/biotin-[acetyl-CoA-carboxylase] ligase
MLRELCTMAAENDRIDTQRVLTTGTIADVLYFESIDSTHTRAHDLARANSSRLPLLVLAEQQTAGRGRGANRWWTGRGSLAFSLVFDPVDWSLAGEVLPQRSLAVGVAIVDTVQPLLPVAAGLHWPNDVFVAGRKVAGILVDILADGRHVVGIGLNVNNPMAAAPAEVRARATSLCELAGRTLDRTEVLCELLVNLKRTLQASAADPEAFGSRFGELCMQLGQELTVEAAGRQTTGTCAGIAADGALLLKTADGSVRIYSGVIVR